MESKNFTLALILSAVIVFGFQYLFVKPEHDRAQQAAAVQKTAEQTTAPKPEAPQPPRARAEIIKDNPRLSIMTPELRGSINLKGARIDDLDLAQYRETVADQSPQITLLSPSGSASPHHPYYAEFSWLSDNKDVAVPTAQAEWKADNKQLSQAKPVKLTWNNGQGLTFERTIAVDEHYMFTITDRIDNKGSSAVTLYPFGLVARQGTPASHAMSTISHEGPLGVLDGTLDEISYSKLTEKGKESFTSTGGWLGFTDKYWLVALIPPQDEKLAAEYVYSAGPNKDPALARFQADFRGSPVTIEPNASAEHTTRMFAGAKRVRVLDDYADQFKIPHFDRAIDFGWFYFLTKPFLYLLDFLGSLFASFGIAILVFTVGLKLITLPLSLKSYHSMSKVRALQPEMKRIQERFADDRIRQNQEMMELYQREKVNPMAGCVPQLVQIPIFFALYKVLYVGIELRQAPFFGWIRDMSTPDPTTLITLFGLFPDINKGVLAAVDYMHTLPGIVTLFGVIPTVVLAVTQIGVWPLLMGVSMFLQQKLSPQPPDKMQARMFMLMPILFTFMLAQMPSGLVIYWTWSNLIGILQQWYIMRQDEKKKLI